MRLLFVIIILLFITCTPEKIEPERPQVIASFVKADQGIRFVAGEGVKIYYNDTTNLVTIIAIDNADTTGIRFKLL